MTNTVKCSWLPFASFNRPQSGRVVTNVGDWFAIVNARNRYGSHNLVAVDLDSGDAFCHGNYAVVQFLLRYKLGKQLSRVASHFDKRGRTLPLDPPTYPMPRGKDMRAKVECQATTTDPKTRSKRRVRRLPID